jgi:hypothetical protein
MALIHYSVLSVYFLEEEEEEEDKINANYINFSKLII